MLVGECVFLHAPSLFSVPCTEAEAHVILCTISSGALSWQPHVVSDPAGHINTIVLVTMVKQDVLASLALLLLSTLNSLQSTLYTLLHSTLDDNHPEVEKWICSSEDNNVLDSLHKIIAIYRSRQFSFSTIALVAVDYLYSIVSHGNTYTRKIRELNLEYI